MSRTVDANVLLYASDTASPHHAAARAVLDQVATGPELVTIFWPTVMAYLRLSTHPSVFASPLPLEVAVANIEQLLARPHVRAAGEGPAFWTRFREVADDARPTGNLVPDAHLASLMLEHGVATIVTRDRDFRRFPHVRVEDVGEP